jgi:hypothetical protein
MADPGISGADSHDPDRHLNSLLQSLSQGRTPIGVFIGAGCPVSIRVTDGAVTVPLIPDVAGLTKLIFDEILRDTLMKEVLTSLLSQFSTDGRPAPNIEDMLSHVRSLRLVAGKSAIRDLSIGQLAAIEQKICEKIALHAGKELPADRITPYHRLAEWIGGIPREQPIEIFTTNYDLLMEQALEERHIPYFDGFVGSRETFFDLHAIENELLPPRWARLWKLHGSINWQAHDDGEVRRTVKPGTSGQAMIFPCKRSGDLALDA